MSTKTMRTPKVKNIFIVACYMCIAAIILIGVALAYFGGSRKYSILPAFQPVTTPADTTDTSKANAETEPVPSVLNESDTHFDYKVADLVKKQALIISNNIDDVTSAIRVGHIPDTETDYRSFSNVTLRAFKFNLNTTNYQKLVDSINISFLKNTEGTTVNQMTWEGYSHSEASGMYTKNGYACIIMEPNRFGTPPYINCANVANLSMNTLNDVASFMLKNLISAGIDCEAEECKIVETQEEFPLNKYSRKLVYFDKDIVGDNATILISDLSYEASQSAKFLESSGWSTKLQDYTNKEYSWNKQTVASILITAENHYFRCSHTITIMNKDKRQMVECAYKDEVLEEVQRFYNPYK